MKRSPSKRERERAAAHIREWLSQNCYPDILEHDRCVLKIAVATLEGSEVDDEEPMIVPPPSMWIKS